MGNKQILMEFSPSWVFISDLWKYLNALFMHEINDPFIVQGQVASVIELLENAIKYSDLSEGDPTVKLNISFQPEEELIVVGVENKSNEKDIIELQQEIKEVTSSDPQKIFYERLMRTECKEGHGAQLGITRLLYEGKGTIDLKVNNNYVTIVATFKYHPNIVNKRMNDEI